MGAAPTPAPPQSGGGEGESVEDAAPLTLTLGAPRFCETQRGHGSFYARVYQDDEGNWHSETYSLGWGSVAETPVTWSVSGGVEPYTLVIDGEARDAEQTYAGADGTATVSCAQQIGETFIDHGDGIRRYRTRPEIDSGVKTIRATVTDGAGAAAQASVEMYVILELGGSGDILERGKTYRVFGHLITAPADYDVEVGSVISVECDSDLPPDVRCESSFRLWLVDTGAQVDLFMSDGAEGESGSRRYPNGVARGARCGARCAG